VLVRPGLILIDEIIDFRSNSFEKPPLVNAVATVVEVLASDEKMLVIRLFESAAAIIPVESITGRKKITLASPFPKKLLLSRLEIKKLKIRIINVLVRIPLMAFNSIVLKYTSVNRESL
jgi:hypothetical protein